MHEQFVVLGLGANLGQRLAQFADAIRHLQSNKILKDIRVSEIFESEALLQPGSPAEWNIPFFNIAVSGTCRLPPRELLETVKSIEHSLGRCKRERWAPREIDIDILTYGEEGVRLEGLEIPHPGLLDRPFALWPLTALAPLYRITDFGTDREITAMSASKRWGSVRSEIPCRTWRAAHPIQNQWVAEAREIGVPVMRGPIAKAELVGVINVTPDSFSDGGKHFAPAAALSQSINLYEAGASILDFGAESTRPGAKPIDANEEWARLAPVLEAVHENFAAKSLKPLLSIDTRHADVAKRAVDFGIDWINDVEGLSNPRMIDAVAPGKCDVVVMHSLGIPPSKDHVLRQTAPAISQLLEWGQATLDRLNSAGIKPDRVILDPGIGFGKTAEQSAEIVANAGALAVLGARILVGHSRKSFQSLFTERPSEERDPETAILSALLARQNIDYLRVHDVGRSARAIQLLQPAGLPPSQIS